MKEKTAEQLGYIKLIDECAAALAEDEFWCIIDPDGEILGATIDKRLDEPIITFCDTVKCDWDDATEAGFRLGRCKVHDANILKQEVIR